MGKSQQTKGKGGEREVVNLLIKAGFTARRGQVWNHEPDIVCPSIPIHLEVKRQEELKLPEWFRQAEKDSGWKYPAVVFRQSRKPWLVYMRASDFVALITGENLIASDGFIIINFIVFLDILKEVENGK